MQQVAHSQERVKAVRTITENNYSVLELSFVPQIKAVPQQVIAKMKGCFFLNQKKIEGLVLKCSVDLIFSL